jgi:hypothetical protein
MEFKELGALFRKGASGIGSIDRSRQILALQKFIPLAVLPIVALPSIALSSRAAASQSEIGGSNAYRANSASALIQRSAPAARGDESEQCLWLGVCE